METAVRVEHLVKHVNHIKAVDDISFRIEKGELFGFLGVNGAGKSTTINILCTLFPQTAGTVEICGCRLGKENEEIRRKIGMVRQNNCLDDDLSVKENLLVRGSLYERDRIKLHKKLADVCEMMGLQDVYGRRYARLSGGQKRRCEIAGALLHVPEILFLDEPTTGLDPATRKDVWESVEKLRQELKMTVFLTTHYMEEAARASTVVILDGGHIKEQGTPFYLKELYAKDKLKLIPAAGREADLWEVLRKENLSCQKKEEYIVLTLTNSMQAVPLLERYGTLLAGFEMVQGTMDDVFLQMTGRKPEEGFCGRGEDYGNDGNTD